MKAPRRKTVFLVDDHPVLRRGLKMVFAEEPDFKVCGEASGAVEALAAIRNHPPDIAIVDLSLQQGSGLDLIKQLQDATPTLPILVLSAQPETRYAEPCLRAGARGYIEKTEDIGQVIEATREIISGRVYLSALMKERVLCALSGGPQKETAAAPDACLSEREMAVFELIGQGIRTREIADKLCVSPKTVQVYRDKIRDKLGYTDGQELQHAAFLWVNQNTP